MRGPGRVRTAREGQGYGMRIRTRDSMHVGSVFFPFRARSFDYKSLFAIVARKDPSGAPGYIIECCQRLYMYSKDERYAYIYMSSCHSIYPMPRWEPEFTPRLTIRNRAAQQTGRNKMPPQWFWDSVNAPKMYRVHGAMHPADEQIVLNVA